MPHKVGDCYVATMAVFGITGGIAAGKTTFRNLLAPQLDADVFDADATAKELLQNDEGIRVRVIAALGPQAYSLNGSPDRGWIRGKIFADTEAKAHLEAILHPAVRKLWISLAGEVRYRTRHLLIDIPLLFETRADEKLQNVITVACSDSIQRERLRTRGLSDEIADRIISNQLPQTVKIARSQHVIWTDGSLAALDAQAAALATSISSIFGVSSRSPEALLDAR